MAIRLLSLLGIGDPIDRRLKNLRDKIHLYDPTFDIEEIRSALDYVTPQGRGNKKKPPPSHRDLFVTDPLLLLETVLEFSRPDRATILAAILYPFMRPLDKSAAVNYAQLQEIETLFSCEGKSGQAVRNVILDTLRRRALKFVEPKFDTSLDDYSKRKKREEYLRLFLLAGLGTARGRPAILLYGTQVALNLQMEVRRRETESRGKARKVADTVATTLPYSSAKIDNMLYVAEHVTAPLAYVAGLEQLREKVLDLCFQLKNPEKYAETCHKIADAVRQEEAQAVKDQIVKRMSDLYPKWKVGEHFTVDIRPKPAASAHKKADRKSQEVEELGDLCAARIVLLKPAYLSLGDIDAEFSQHIPDEEVREGLGVECKRVYGKFSQQWGRANKQLEQIRPKLGEHGEPLMNDDGTPVLENYSYIQERFAELGVNEPRDKDPGRYDDDPRRKEWEEAEYPDIKDARFDDYISREKPSGYSGIQDTFFIPIVDKKGQTKFIEIEAQFVDPIRHEYNMKGPKAGRVYYKAGLANCVDDVLLWNKIADLPVDERPERMDGEKVFVLNQRTRDIIDVTHNPTVGGFLQTIGCSATEASIYNGVEFPETPVTYGKSTLLRSGCIVCAMG